MTRQVSLLVPSLNQPSLAGSASESLPDNIRVTRSVSDVVKAKGQQPPPGHAEQGSPQHPSSATNDNSKLISNRKTKEERRLSNRQKLLSLKRHSGYLKRPEILETVYSVEEDCDGLQQHQQQQQQQQQEQQQQQQQQQQRCQTQEQQQQEKSEKPEGAGSGECAEKPSSMESPPTGSGSGGPGDTASSVRSPAPLVKVFRQRVDSDVTVSDDYSTDDDSTRIFYSETSTECSCFSQPDSRNERVHQGSSLTINIYFFCNVTTYEQSSTNHGL